MALVASERDRPGRNTAAPTAHGLPELQRSDPPHLLPVLWTETNMTLPINGERFRVYVEQVLIAALPGDIVIIKNLGSHKCKGVRRALRVA